MLKKTILNIAILVDSNIEILLYMVIKYWAMSFCYLNSEIFTQRWWLSLKNLRNLL